MTLAEFLLARIAEDEGEPYHRWDCDKFNVYDYGLRQGDCDCGGPARVLAECEAKRRIVAKAQRADKAFERHIQPATSAASFALTEVLGYLAAPFRDHPDYDPAWEVS